MNLLTTQQAADMLHRTPVYIRQMIADGRLRATRLAPRGPWLIFADSLERLCGVQESQVSDEVLRKRDGELLWMWD